MRAAAIVMSVVVWVTGAAAGTSPAHVADLPAVLADENPVHRLRELKQFVGSLRPEELPGVVNQVIAGHGPGRDNLMDVVSARWVEVDAPAALAFARHCEDRGMQQNIINGYYSTWAGRDLKGALAAIDRLPDAGERGGAVWAAVYVLGVRDPARADELFRSVHATNFPSGEYLIYWYWAQKDLAQATQSLLDESRFIRAGRREEASGAVTDYLLDQDPNAATKWWGQLPAGKLRDQVFDHLVDEWARVDPNAVVTWLTSLPPSDPVRNALSRAQSRGDDSDTLRRVKIDAAFAPKWTQLTAILDEPNSWRELQAELKFVDGLSAAEFPEALERLRNLPGGNRDEVMDLLVARWMEVDTPGAMRAIPRARAIHDTEFSQKFLLDFFDDWSWYDPDLAFAVAHHLSLGNAQPNIRQVALAGLARENPERAYATYQKLDDPNMQMLVTPVFTEWAAADLPAATKALADEKNWTGAIDGIITGLMRKGRVPAIAWAKQVPAGERRDHALREIADLWSNDDPAAAMAWLESQPEFKDKNSALDDVAVNWAIRNPTEALRHAAKLPDGTEKSSLQAWSFGQMTYDDARAAAGLVAQLPLGEMRKHSLSAVLENWSEYDPIAAAIYLASVANEATPSDAKSVAQSWSSLDPAGAASWAMAFPGAASKAAAIESVAETWSHTDATRASYWVNQLPAGPLYDAGANGLGEGFNGAVGVKWAESIGDSKLRHDETYAVLKRWIQGNGGFVFTPDATAEAAIKASGLSDAEKKTLLDLAPKVQNWKTTLFVPPVH